MWTPVHLKQLLFFIFHSHAFSFFGTHFITSFSPWPSNPLAWHRGTRGCKVVRLMRKIKAVCIFLHVCVRARGFPPLKRFTLARVLEGQADWKALSLSDICCPPCCSVTGLIHVLLVLSLSVSLSESLGTSPLSVSLSMRGGESDEVGKWGRKGRAC